MAKRRQKMIKNMTTKEEASEAAFKIKLFGIFREAAGGEEVAVTLHCRHATVADLKKSLSDCYPALSSLNMPFIVAVNRKVAADSTMVQPNDEIALLPMISGG